MRIYKSWIFYKIFFSLFFKVLKVLSLKAPLPHVYNISYIQKKIKKIQKTSTSYRAVISILFILYHFFIFFQTHRKFSEQFFFFAFVAYNKSTGKKLWHVYVFDLNLRSLVTHVNVIMRCERGVCCIYALKYTKKKQTEKAKCCIYLFIYLYNLNNFYYEIYSRIRKKCSWNFELQKLRFFKKKLSKDRCI